MREGGIGMDATGVGGQRDEIAAFVDFENIRHGTVSSFGREPDPISWRDKVLEHGLLGFARAYADFDLLPAPLRARLEVAGFEPHHAPTRRTIDHAGRERIVSRAELALTIDAITTALSRPDITTFMLLTGDKDFVRLVALLRNRLGKRVIVCGLPGSVSPDLIAAAGEYDLLSLEPYRVDDGAVIRGIQTYVRQLHEGFVPTQSHMSRSLWRFLDRSALPSEHIEAKVMEFVRRGILVKRQTINGQNQELITTELNLDNPIVVEALESWSPPAPAPDGVVHSTAPITE